MINLFLKDENDNFVGKYRYVKFEDSRYYKLYCFDKNLIKFQEYIVNFSVYDTEATNRFYINDLKKNHIFYDLVNDEFIENNKVKELKNTQRNLIFEFPDDYPEEELFYFKLKYGVENYDL